jgi:GAF domain-containing protein
LRLAENDRQRSTTDINYRRLVADTAISVVREVADHVSETAASEDEDAENQGRAGSAEEPPATVLCLSGRTELDLAASEMVAQVLDEQGIGTRVLPPIAVSQGALGQLDLAGVEVVCLSYLHPQPQVYARYVCRRLRRRAPHLRLVACLWNLPPQAGNTEDIVRQVGADAVYASLDACVAQVKGWVGQEAPAEGPAPVLPDVEQERLAALRELGLTAARSSHFDTVAGRIAQSFSVPIALVSFADSESRPQPETASAPAGSARQEDDDHSLEAYVVAANDVLVVADVTVDPRFADNPLVLEKGIRFYAGAPLRTSAGIVIGTLSIIDTEPRDFSDDDRRRLQKAADDLMAEITRQDAKAVQGGETSTSVGG